MASDPYAVLGVPISASADEIRKDRSQGLRTIDLNLAKEEPSYDIVNAEKRARFERRERFSRKRRRPIPIIVGNFAEGDAPWRAAGWWPYDPYARG